MSEKDYIKAQNLTRIRLAEAVQKASEAARAFTKLVKEYFPAYKPLDQTEEEE